MKPYNKFMQKCRDASSYFRITIILIIVLIVVSFGNANEYPKFEKSNVIGFCPMDVEVYKRLNVDFVSWGHIPQPPSYPEHLYHQQIKRAEKYGTLIGASLGTRTAWREFIDFQKSDIEQLVCKNIDGEFLKIPDERDSFYNGFPAFWFTSNSMEFRRYQKYKVRQIVKAKAHGLLIDDPIGSTAALLWFNGCYNVQDNEKFNLFLEKKSKLDDIRAQGYNDIKAFNIYDLHQKFRSIDADKRPLFQLLLNYFMESALDGFLDLKKVVREEAKTSIPITCNIDPTSSLAIGFLPHLDYFSFECEMGAKTMGLKHFKDVFTFKVAEALKKPIAIVGNGDDHAEVATNNLSGMVRSWIAQAYANGGFFMVPYHLYSYKPEKGVFWYEPDLRDFEPLYKFIKSHRYLFDGFKSIATTGILCDISRISDTWLYETVKDLFIQNIPFEIEFVEIEEEAAKIYKKIKKIKQKYKILIVEKHLKNIISNSVSTNGKLNLEILYDKKLISDVQKIMVSHKDVYTSLRVNDSSSINRYALHLLNYDYSFFNDRCFTKKNIKIIIPKQILQEPLEKEAAYYSVPEWEGKEIGNRVARESLKTEIKIVETESGKEILVPELGPWGIIQLNSKQIR